MLKTEVWEINVKLFLGWGFLIPVWIVIINSIGVVDKTTGLASNEWILLLPSLITAMMMGLTIWYFKVRRLIR